MDSSPSTSGHHSTGPTTSSGGVSGDAGAGLAMPKRTRVLLSCTTCRTSKLKCDRAQPCGQCLKKGRADSCVYTPKPNKPKAAKSMAARLKRLEGMVRQMIDDEGDRKPTPSSLGPDASVSPRGQVVQGERTTTYVGATHFMAVLEDIEDLKNYFEEPEVQDEHSPQNMDDFDGPELLLLSKSAPRNREDLMMMLPEKPIVDRLIMRYFTSNSPSQHIVHRPTFTKDYNKFWQDPSNVSIHWIALLFMILALGVFFSSFQAPHELSADSPEPAMDRFRQYRSAATWALVWGKYNQPTAFTVQPFLLYVESEFLLSRAAQMNCYLLSSVCIRIMLKMGLHRDPSKLAGISPFAGEMRRRMWNLAIQLDLLVSFHMGLPSMIHGIDSDTVLPRNLLDEDFDENSQELPLGRPASDYTPMTYPIFKSALCRVFGMVARQAHLLTAPAYSEVMALDQLLNEKWDEVPPFMKVKPLEECVTDLPSQIIQRFGLASLYQKSRCVLHRRYLTEAIPKKEHEYSRRTCVEAALTMLDYQNTIYLACQPGGILSQNGWFVSALAVHDFLLAAMIIYLVLQNNNYSEVGGNYDWMAQGTPTPTKAELLVIMKRSFSIWSEIAKEVPDVQKTADILKTMLGKVDSPSAASGSDGSVPQAEAVATPMSSLALNDAPTLPSATLDNPSTSRSLGQGQSPAFEQMSLDPSLLPGNVLSTGGDAMWMTNENGLDWRYFDNAMARASQEVVDQQWAERSQINELDFLVPEEWDPSR